MNKKIIIVVASLFILFGMLSAIAYVSDVPETFLIWLLTEWADIRINI